MRRGAILPILLGAQLLFAGPATLPQDEEETWNRPVPEWWEGPVRYALTDEETREYRSLTAEAERATFISRFWAARDPNPLTPANEVEEMFWARVKAADELFTHTTISGWRTDQGRVYIILGPPDELTTYASPSAEQLDPTHFPDPYHRGDPAEIRPGQQGAEEWTYRSLKSSAADAGQKITFVRDGSGEYHLSSPLAPSFRFEVDPQAAANNFRTLTAMSQGKKVGNNFTNGGSGPQRGPDPHAMARIQYEALKANEDFSAVMNSFQSMFAFGKAELLEGFEPPAGGKALVTATESFGTIQLLGRIGLFPGNGGTNAVITLGLPLEEAKPDGNSARPVEIFGTLEKAENPSRTYQVSTVHPLEESAPLQEVGDHQYRLYLVRGELAPGDYQAKLGIRVGDRVGSYQERIQVPDFGGEGLKIAGPILAVHAAGGVPTETAPESPSGGLRVLPKLVSVYRAEEEFAFYYQVCHAHPDGTDGRLHLDMSYAVAVRQNGRYVPLGKPVLLSDNPSPTHAYVFPLKGWSVGEYLLTVTAVDRVSGEVSTASAFFMIR